MSWRFVLNILGALLFFFGLIMIFPLLVGLYYRDQSLIPLLESMAVTIFAGLMLYFIFRKAGAKIINQREGMAIVSVGWTAVGLFGALPFYLGDAYFKVTDAVFESVSGFTTTGASILTNIEAVSKGLLFWRSFIQWLGGMGIIVLSVAILPFLGVGGMQLYKVEVPSPVPDKLKPRIRDTTMILWKVYALISLVQVLMLMLGDMNLYDALCHTFTTMPTGGFFTKNFSIAHFNSVYFDCVFISFMLLAGINFSLHYQMLRGKPLAFWQDSECRFFIGAVILITFVASLDVFGSVYETIGEALRYGAFQVVSIVTTTGFATADYEQWPPMSQLILLLCMFLGASAGSTGGGMKCLRVMLCFKYCYKELFSLIHPHAVSHVKIAGKPVPDDIMRIFTITTFLVLFSINSVASAGENDIFEIEAEGSYRMEAGSSIDLVKKLALFIAKRKAVDLAGRYLSRKSLIDIYELNRDEIYSLAAKEIRAEILEEKWETVEKNLTYRVRINAQIKASDFIKAEMEDTKQEKNEAKESYQEEMEQHISAEIDPGRDIAKSYRLLREKKWRVAMIYLNHLEKNIRVGTTYIWPKP